MSEMSEIRAKWVAALKSGEYSQTRGMLRRRDGFCCLGVLCDLAVKEGIIPEPTLSVGNKIYSYDEEAGVLPVKVREWVGLSDVHGNYATSSLITDNDGGRSFNVIAEIIESEPKGLFKENNEAK
jgi:hypothetical protein